MAATKRSRAKRASSIGMTVENGVVELKKSLESLRRMIEGYLPSGSGRPASRGKTRRTAARRPKRKSPRRAPRGKRVA